MVTRRGALALVSLAVLVLSTALFAQGRGNTASQVDPKKLSDAQKKEMQAVSTLVDSVMAGQPAPNDLGLEWSHQDLLKATNNRE